MRNTIFAIAGIALLSACGSHIPSADVPQAARSAFEKTYPDAQSVEWEKEDGGYEVSFKKNGEEMTANFDGAGKMTETEEDMPLSKLPAAAKDYLDKNYGGQKIKETSILHMADGSINYEAEVDGMDVIFTEDGNFIRTQKLK